VPQKTKPLKPKYDAFLFLLSGKYLGGETSHETWLVRGQRPLSATA
jgi:hypothetical protein